MFKLLFPAFLFLAALKLGAYASPYSSPRPLVIWHGLGDSHSSPGILEFISEIKDIHNGIFVHSVYIDPDLDKDRRAGFYGNVNEQIELVASQISDIPELHGGFDAIGFSQGGQFLRAYIEQYNSPPVNNLITFGSQHMGISDIPICRPFDVVCQIARRATKGAVYGKWAQENLIQAQYFRDPANLETYLSANHFLPYINNEIIDSRNQTYARNLASLSHLILVLFTKDVTVVPKESAWFGSEEVSADAGSPTPNGQAPLPYHPVLTDKTIIPMHLQPLYVEDWIGLRELDERGSIIFESCEGEHMRLGNCWQKLVRKYVGQKL